MNNTLNPLHKLISVIIPYYQKKAGILNKALQSILSQELRDGWAVEILVVDDGSPHPAAEEIRDIVPAHGFHLRVITQPNGGVVAARNRGLDAVGNTTEIIAFLDSDDVWPQGHVQYAIDAYSTGFDCFFADNCREDYHGSYINEVAPRTAAALKNATQIAKNIIEVPKSLMAGLVLEEFPTQASTVAYRKSIAADLRFNHALTYCGEDVLFFTTLVSRCKRIAFNPLAIVECGKGINIYFGHFGWDDENLLPIKADQIRTHTLIGQIPNLEENAYHYNSKRLNRLRCDFIFHTIRRIVKGSYRIPPAVRLLARDDKYFALWGVVAFIRISFAYPLRLYRP